MGASSVRMWVKHFKAGNTDNANELCCGQPRTAVTEHNKHNVYELKRQHQNMTEKLQHSLEWGTMRSGK